jgi:hypothetical protein
MKKIAVAIIHGVGTQGADFADDMIRMLKERFARDLKSCEANPETQLEFEFVHWAPVLQNTQDELWKRMVKGGDMDFRRLRKFMVDFAADAVAYQPAISEQLTYNRIHTKMAESLGKLAQRAGADAPLCVVSVSLGTVIASNYFYDLQNDTPQKPLVPNTVRSKIGNTPLEKGETFALFYTLGSPLALWSLRYENFGSPIDVPSSKLAKHHAPLKGEWINLYDEDDVIGYPLKTLNPLYRERVKADKTVNVGGILTSWNPASHLKYWTDAEVIKTIVTGLVRTWKAIHR